MTSTWTQSDCGVYFGRPVVLLFLLRRWTHRINMEEPADSSKPSSRRTLPTSREELWIPVTCSSSCPSLFFPFCLLATPWRAASGRRKGATWRHKWIQKPRVNRFQCLDHPLATAAIRCWSISPSPKFFGRIDLTDKGIHTLDDASIAVVQSLEDTVRIFISDPLPDTIKRGSDGPIAWCGSRLRTNWKSIRPTRKGCP